MTIQDTYPLLTVARLEESRDFFVRCFAMTVVFEASWVAMLGSSDDGSIAVGLMSSDHPSRPPGPELFEGTGLVLTIQVDDATAAYARLAGEAIVHPLTDQAWGQRRFMVRDPSGIFVDVVEQIDPDPAFWPRYTG